MKGGLRVWNLAVPSALACFLQKLVLWPLKSYQQHSIKERGRTLPQLPWLINALPSSHLAVLGYALILRPVRVNRCNVTYELSMS